MANKFLKTISLLTLIAIPRPINEGYSPRLEKLENIEAAERIERIKTNARYNLIEINENIVSLERKRDFFLMRLNEKDFNDSIKNDYLKRLNETNNEIKKYYSKKDSIYTLISE